MSAPLEWCSQARPEMPGFPRHTLDIASAELPCGASWLGNLLLELRIPIFHPWGANTRAEWHCRGLRRFRYQRPDEGWRRLLPALRHGRVFNFRKSPVPRLGHHWPGHYSPDLPAILVVRDPRDALYSAWRRERALGALAADLAFVDFIDAPFRNWPLSWSGYYAAHTAAWLDFIHASGGLLLRFEDFKRTPLRQAQRILDYLRVRVPPQHLYAAVAASEHGEIARAEHELLARGSVPSALLAGGRVEEWRTHYTDTTHAAIPDWIWPVFAGCGYVAARSGKPGLPPDPRTLRAFNDEAISAPNALPSGILTRALDLLHAPPTRLR